MSLSIWKLLTYIKLSRLRPPKICSESFRYPPVFLGRPDNITLSHTCSLISFSVFRFDRICLQIINREGMALCLAWHFLFKGQILQWLVYPDAFVLKLYFSRTFFCDLLEEKIVKYNVYTAVNYNTLVDHINYFIHLLK